MNNKNNIRFFYPLIILSWLLIVHSCASKAPRTIDPEFAKYIAAFSFGSVSSASSIQIELNQDMPAVQLNEEIPQELFEFSPKIKGKAYWTSARTIKFVPEPGEMKKGETYDAWFKLGDVMKVDSKYKEFYFYFNIPDQNFTVDLLPYSPIKENDPVWNKVTGTLSLADEESIDDISKMFSVEGSETAKVKVEPTSNKGCYSFTIDSLERKDYQTTYGLRVDGKPIGVGKEEKQFISIPKLNLIPFEVVDVRLDYDPSQCVRVTFSDPLSANQNIQGLISMNGVDNYSYDIDKNVLKLYIDPTKNTTSVSLKIVKELKNSDNKPLEKNYNYALSLEKVAPEIKLLNAGNILPNSESLNIPFQAINLWAVDVAIVKIFENNILGYLQSNNLGENNELRRFGRLVMKKRIRLDEDFTKPLDEWNDFNLDLSTLIKQDPGAIYRVEFSMKKEYSLYPCGGTIPRIPQEAPLERFDNKMTEEEEAIWDIPETYYYNDYYGNGYKWAERDDPCKESYYIRKSYDCIVFASNIGIIAKMGSDKKIAVALSDIIDTRPLPAATVDVYNFQMQRIGSGKTDSNGFVEIEYKGGTPFAVVASNGKDKGYLKVTSNLSLSLSNFDVDGQVIQKGLKGYIYGERGVWRPGDSIHVTFVLEDKEKTLPKDHPVSLEFFSPSGQLYQRIVNTSGTNGFYPFKLSTNANDPTGNWSTVIKVGGASFYKTIKVETVKPNRLKLRLNLNPTIDASLGSLHTSLSAQWLHGAPAANLKAKVEMTLSMVRNPFKGYETYSFNNPANRFFSDTYTVFDSQLNASGDANIEAKLPQAANAPGLLRASFVSRVFETGGDASIYTQSTTYSPYPAYIGVKSPTDYDYQMLETDADNMLDIVSLSPDGKPVGLTNINVKIYKINWSWWWNRTDNNLSSYINNTSTRIVLDENISTSNNGKAKVKFRVDYPEWGRYLVIATDKQGGHITGKIIYVDWPSWRGRADKGDAAGLTMLSFSTDKQNYSVGEKATIIIPKSSNGHALISIENGSKVISRNWVATNAGEDTKYTFEVTEEMNPNFYVFATLLQPHAQEDNDLPIRLYGVLNINVDNKNTILTPVINMPDELRPETEFTVSVSEQKKKPMTYTLAIVDEGLLDLTAFKTPNAWNDFYARQALGVRTWDMFDMVVGAQAGKLGPLLSIGGDEALKPESNTANRFKPVVKYLGPFTLKKGETQSHKITMPAYVGSVRAMVVAGNQDGAYGNAEKAVQVKNPLMILSTLPRVAGPNEEILLPVNVFAMDKKVKNVTVNVKSGNGLLELADGNSKSVTFSETGDKIVYFKLKASPKTGVEKISINASGGGESASETIEIEVRNPNPPVILTSEALVSAGQSHELKIEMDDPTSGDWARLEVSRMPSVDLNKNMSYLLDYPYGCSEQVTSKVLPLLYVDVFKSFTEKETERIKYNINEGIKTLISRQLGDGGIAYWSGQTYPTEWVTTYAGHFLIEAKAKGYNVPESAINKWIQFQKKAAQRWNRGDLYNSYYSHSMYDLQQAYRLYTLALANEPELGAMNRLKEMKDLSVQTRWRLAAAYILAGRKDAARELIGTAPVSIDNYSVYNNTYGTPARDKAMIMETYLLLDNIPKALDLAKDISKELSSYYISTQTVSFGLMSMSKLAAKMGKGQLAFDWTLNGAQQKNLNSGSVFHEFDIKPQNINVNFTNKGEGELYVRLIGRTRPLEDKLDPINDGINLYVKYVDVNNKEVDVKSLTQGTEFYAVVTVQNISGEYITDLALNQIFPSGWEIFNSRLFDAGRNMNNNTSITYQDIRDDRVMTFFNLQNGYSNTIRVRLQAAYCGKFYLPAIHCSAMYEPETQSRTKGMWVEVVQ